LETLVTAVTSRQLFEDERTFAEFLHAEEIRLEERQHDAEQRQAQQLHKHKLQYDTDLFVHDMRVDIALATRDATRDAIRQCSQVASSVAMCDALLLNCVFLLVSQFNLPSVSPDADGSVDVYTTARLRTGTMIWAICLAGSFVALIGSAIACLMLQKVVSAYDIGHPLRRYHPCGRSHSNFNHYFACHCKRPEQHSRRLCAAGAVATLAAAGVWAYMTFVASGAVYNVGAFALFVFPVSVTIILSLIGPWMIPDRTRRGAREFVGYSAMATAASNTAIASPYNPHHRAATTPV
jgi:hypothetical protein